MPETTKATVVYYSATGNVHALAVAAAEGAEKAGAEVRLRRAPELAPESAVAENPAWAEHLRQTRDIAEATVHDLVWADAVLLGSPTRYGMMASQLKQFVDSTGPEWQQGLLADKAYGAFTSTISAHGGQESTLLSMYTVFAGWGGVIVPPGYTAPIQFEVGNPYGTSHVSGMEAAAPTETHLEGARYQARRTTEIATGLKAGRAGL
ncbi:NAD(P)H:quinone oxidoreductase [Streptomonospora salina]|uniref:NAD(P)H dehydrogenase (Quinone) n=1 Tax=Streptomonospora salina TaxID=104205 RepID=A0A841E087_9ACTN|nr:NAD(P)H:quinone oxidoreductase [Streptomonospora salina]MBB5996545.1 NAD(P)H dehydrogenase (quinone) [Streptomonospora salina]